MSTAISSTQTSTILPKSIAMLRINKDEKPRLQRTSSIDAIKRINTFICSPQSYILPAILTTWLKTGQTGLQNSTEKTILTFRSIIFGSILFKYLLSSAQLDLKRVVQLIANVDRILLISLAFKLAVTVLTVQCYLCIQYLSQKHVPLGLGFLLLCSTAISVLGHKLNRFYLIKRDRKCKTH